jgi:hypothetical protein
MIEFHSRFLGEAKKLSKKFKLIKNDIKKSVEEIENGYLGTSLGNSLYKKRVPNSSIPTGKSGGFRIILFEKIEDKIVLLSIYSKTQQESLSDSELKDILKTLEKNEHTN